MALPEPIHPMMSYMRPQQNPLLLSGFGNRGYQTSGLTIPFTPNPHGPNLLPGLEHDPAKIPTLPTQDNPHGVPGGVPPLDLTPPTGPVSPGPTLPKQESKPQWLQDLEEYMPEPPSWWPGLGLWNNPYGPITPDDPAVPAGLRPDSGGQTIPGFFGGVKTKDYLTF